MVNRDRKSKVIRKSDIVEFLIQKLYQEIKKEVK